MKNDVELEGVDRLRFVYESFFRNYREPFEPFRKDYEEGRWLISRIMEDNPRDSDLYARLRQMHDTMQEVYGTRLQEALSHAYADEHVFLSKYYPSKSEQILEATYTKQLFGEDPNVVYVNLAPDDLLSLMQDPSSRQDFEVFPAKVINDMSYIVLEMTPNEEDVTGAITYGFSPVQFI